MQEKKGEPAILQKEGFNTVYESFKSESAILWEKLWENVESFLEGPDLLIVKACFIPKEPS